MQEKSSFDQVLDFLTTDNPELARDLSGLNPEGAVETDLPTVPDYLILRKIGEGGFGTVWLARNMHDDQFYALKMLHADREYELNGIREFKKRSNEQPNLISIGHVGKVDDRFYYVMPLADNALSSKSLHDSNNYEPATLESHLDRQGYLGVESALLLAQQVLRGLEELHKHGAIHRDIKPANILRFSGQWVLGDPGLIGTLKEDVVVGTDGFVNEQFLNSPKGDLYALGVTIKQSVKPQILNASDRSSRQLARLIERTTTNGHESFHSSAEMCSAVDKALRPRRHKSLWLQTALASLLIAAFLLSRVRTSEPAKLGLQPSDVAITNGVSTPLETVASVVNVQRWWIDLNGTSYGPDSGPLRPEVSVGDQFGLHLELDRASHLCVVPFDPSGESNPIEQGTWIQELEKRLHFPRSKGSAIAYELDASGVQAFAVFSSESPIAAKAWSTQLRNTEWSAFEWPEKAFWWCTADQIDVYRQTNRGQVRVVEPPAEFSRLRRRLAELDDGNVQLVYLCMFTIDTSQE